MLLAPDKLGFDNVQESRWILLSGTLCNSDIFDHFLDYAGVEKANRFAVSLEYAEPDRYLVELNALLCPCAMSALAAARCPIRLLTGSADTSTPFALAQAAASVAMDGQALLLKGLGHYALLEDPELCHSTLQQAGY